VSLTGPEMSDFSIFPPFFFFVGVDFSFSFSFLSSLTLTASYQQSSHHQCPPPRWLWALGESDVPAYFDLFATFL
jgi:hypothetical protein